MPEQEIREIAPQLMAEFIGGQIIWGPAYESGDYVVIGNVISASVMGNCVDVTIRQTHTAIGKPRLYSTPSPLHAGGIAVVRLSKQVSIVGPTLVFEPNDKGTEAVIRQP